MEQIVISSFQWWLANDRNRGQEGSFWNSQNIEYRQNSSYIELARWVTKLFDVPYEVRDITFWNDGSSLANSLVVFTSNGIYLSTWATVTSVNFVWAWQAENRRFCFSPTNLYLFTDPNTISSLDTFLVTSSYRSSADWFWDLLIADGNNVSVLPEGSTTLAKFPTSWTIWNLAWQVYKIQVIWPNVYVWCNDDRDTILYIWDWASTKASQVIRYEGKFFHNAIVVNNTPIWWAGTQNGRTEVNVWAGYDYQTFIKSGYGKYPLASNANDEKNRMKVYVDRNYHINAMDNVWDVAYLPWYGRIYSFGAYLPWDKYSMACDYTFTGEYPSVILSNWLSGSSNTYSLEWMIVFASKNGSVYDINCINTGIEGVTPAAIYASSGFVESMEYVAESFAEAGNDRKIIVPFDLPHSSCSIKVSEKSDRGSYNLIKTITTTDYGTWYSVAEIGYTNRWRTRQFKFELITSNTAYSPKLYTGITNLYEITWKKV